MFGTFHGAATSETDEEQGTGRDPDTSAETKQEPPGLPQRPPGQRGEGPGSVPQRHLLQAGRG